MATSQQTKTAVTRIVESKAGELSFEESTPDPRNDTARIGQAMALRREMDTHHEMYHILWDATHHTPREATVGGKEIGLFYQGEVYDPDDCLIGRYHRLPTFQSSEEVPNEAVLYLL